MKAVRFPSFAFTVAVALGALQMAFGAEPQPIDLATVLRLAGADNLQVRIAREKVTAARADAASARDRMLPWFTVGANARQHENNIQAVDGTILDADKRSVSLGVGLNGQWDFGELYYQKLSAQQYARATEAALSTQRQNSVTDAAVAYYELLRAQALIVIAADAVTISERHRAQLSAGLSAGVTFAGDVQRVVGAKARNEALVEQARERARTAGARLAEILHLDPAIEFAPVGYELVPTSLVSPTEDLAALISQALADRPEITESDARRAVASAQNDGAHTAPWIPTVSAQAQFGGLGGSAGLKSWSKDFDSSSDYGLGVSWRIGPGGLFDRNRTRSSQARLRQGELELERTRDLIRRQVVESTARSRSLFAQLASIRVAMEAAEKTAQLSRDRRSQSVGNAFEDVIAEEELTRMRADYATAIAQFDQSQYVLLRVLGRRKSDSGDTTGLMP